MAKIADFKCPKCDGSMWDNRANKLNPKAPDFKCQTCGHAIWPEKGQVIQDMHDDQKYISSETAKAPVKVETPDWDAISRGKVRHGVAVAFIGSQGINIDADLKELMELWVDYIMNGK